MAGDAHRPLLPGTNLDSVLSIRQSRTVSQDHTVRWDGVLYQIDRKQVAAGMRGARVQLERRLDGGTWVHWRNRILRLERCETEFKLPIDSPVVKRRVEPERAAWEKALARQRLQDARRRLNESYARLPNRPLWQAMRDSPPRAGELP